MRRARAGQLFGLLLIPTPVFGVDSTPRMGEWVDGWDGAIWDAFSFPFRFGIWTGTFPSLIVPQFAQCDAFQGYKVHLCVSGTHGGGWPFARRARGGRTVRCARAVHALCTRCAKSRPFSTTGRQFFGCRIAAGYYCHCVSL